MLWKSLVSVEAACPPYPHSVEMLRLGRYPRGQRSLRALVRE